MRAVCAGGCRVGCLLSVSCHLSPVCRPRPVLSRTVMAAVSIVSEVGHGSEWKETVTKQLPAPQKVTQAYVVFTHDTTELKGSVDVHC